MMLDFLENMQSVVNPDLKLLRVGVTRFDVRTKVNREYLDINARVKEDGEIEEDIPVFSCEIPLRASVETSHNEMHSVPRTGGSKGEAGRAYDVWASEIIEACEER
jgi:cellulose biosynthesis protein BcsQ